MLFSTIACTEIDQPVIVEEQPPALSAGSADFSKYVAIGASFTAGFTDNALFIAGQNNSFPNMLSQKFAMVGGGEFNQPLMNDNIGGFLVNGTVAAAPRLYFDGTGPAVLPATPTTEITTHLSGTFNNYGIPGMKSFHMGIEGYGTLNPYFGRMASSSTATVLGDAAALGATFFTMSEIGGNDVLSYAASGGSGQDQTGNLDPTTYNGNDITDPTVFTASISTAVDVLTANGAKGVIANVPYITSLSYFTTVPYNPIPLDEATAAQVNQGYAQYNGGLQLALAGGFISADEAARRTINFSAGQNTVVIEDEYLTDLSALGLPSYRQTTAEDLLVLTSSSFIGTLADPNNPASVNGVGVALADKWVLVPEEQLAVANATDAYNATIESIVSSNSNVALVDLKSILQQASSTGIAFDDFTMTTQLVLGGMVSLDGVHLTARGYALMANKFLQVIDENFGSNFVEAGATIKATDYNSLYPVTLP